MDGNVKIYKVVVKGNFSNLGKSDNGKVAYVITNSLDKAYNIVRKHLDNHDLGFGDDRELYDISILAENKEYSAYNILFMDDDILLKKE
jgi:hypothetical protein